MLLFDFTNSMRREIMRKYWEFTQRNMFSEFLAMLGRMTQENLVHQIEYLKIENKILRKRVGRSIRPTPAERRLLVKFGALLGKDIKKIISIVKYETKNCLKTAKALPRR